MIGRIQEILGADADESLNTSMQNDSERLASSAGTRFHRSRAWRLRTARRARW